MNILFTVHTYYPNHDGVQFVTEYLCEGLVKKGHKVDVITYLYKDRCNKIAEEKNGVHILRWEAQTKHTFHIGNKKGYQNYILQHQNKYDVMVNVGTQTALTDWILPIIDKIVLPKILYIHSIWDFRIHNSDKTSLLALGKKIWANIRWKLYYRKYGFAFKKYNIVTQLHENDYSYAFFKDKYGIESIIIENASEDIFFEEKGDKPIYLPKKYILYVANYNNLKNQKEAIDAFYEAKISTNWKLVLIGSVQNSYYDMLVKHNIDMRRRLGLKKGEKDTLLLYGIDRCKTCDYIRFSNAFIMTSKREAFPISLTEALSSKVSFISSNVGIVKHLPGGMIYDKHQELVEKLTLLVSDSNLRHKLSEEGYSFAKKHFKIQEKIDQIEEIAKNITNNK